MRFFRIYLRCLNPFAVLAFMFIMFCFAFNAFAQAVPVPPIATSATTIDVTPWVQFVLSFIQDFGVVLIPIVGAFIGKYVKNENARKALMDGITLAAQGVYEEAVAKGKDLSNIDVKNAGIAKAVNATATIYTAEMKTFGMDSNGLHEAIRKALGGVLASDPTVSATPTKGMTLTTTINEPATAEKPAMTTSVATETKIPVSTVSESPLPPATT